MISSDESRNAQAALAPLDERYRAAQALEEIAPSEPDWQAIEDVVYARVTPMHYLAVLVLLWLFLGVVTAILISLANRWFP